MFGHRGDSSATGPTTASSGAQVGPSTHPSSSSELIPNLPEEIAYLLIGGGTASFGATRAIRVNDPKSKIIIVSNEKWKPYLRPPLSKEIWSAPAEVASKLSFRLNNGTDKSVHYEHEEFYHSLEKLAAKETGGVSVIHGVTVTKINSEEKTAYLSNGQKIKFGKCLLATGGDSFKMNAFQSLPEKLLEDRVIYYRTLDDFIKLHNIFEDKSSKGKSIAIIGGQFLGTELATILSHRSISGKYDIGITQIVEGSGVLSKILPEYLSKFITLRVIKEGPQVITNANVIKAVSKKDAKLGDRIELSLSNGGSVTADYVIVADPVIKSVSGIEIIKPYANLASESNLEIDGTSGGFVANSELQVKSNVYTAGDSANYFDYLTKERKRGGSHDFAIASGRHAGLNMTGKALDFKYTPFYWTDIGLDSIEAVGDISSSYETTGVFMSVPITSLTFGGRIEEISEGNKDDHESQAKYEEEKQEKTPESEYERGVVFYYKNKTLVGILMVNLFNKVHLSRRILQSGPMVKNSDASELAKLYHLYSVED